MIEGIEKNTPGQTLKDMALYSAAKSVRLNIQTPMTLMGQKDAKQEGATSSQICLGPNIPNTRLRSWAPLTDSLLTPEKLGVPRFGSSPREAAQVIKQAGIQFGAARVGITGLDKRHIYSQDCDGKEIVFEDIDQSSRICLWNWISRKNLESKRSARSVTDVSRLVPWMRSAKTGKTVLKDRESGSILAIRPGTASGLLAGLMLSLREEVAESAFRFAPGINRTPFSIGWSKPSSNGRLCLIDCWLNSIKCSDTANPFRRKSGGERSFPPTASTRDTEPLPSKHVDVQKDDTPFMPERPPILLGRLPPSVCQIHTFPRTCTPARSSASAGCRRSV